MDVTIVLEAATPNAFDWVTAVATILALVVAIAAILFTAVVAFAERYTTFQLGLLKELADLVNTDVPDDEHSEGLVRFRAAHSRLRLLDPDLPVLRTRFAAKLQPEEKLALLKVENPSAGGSIDGLLLADKQLLANGCNYVRDQLFDEIASAMQIVSANGWQQCRAMKRKAQQRRTSKPDFP